MILQRVIIVPDSFKGSLSAKEVTKVIAQQVKACFPACEIVSLPIADGGEGSLSTILEATGGTTFSERVVGPDGNLVTAEYGIMQEGTAVIELAQSSGLTRQERLHPMSANTYGFGQLIASALDQGAERFILCIGGSATTDGGCGMAAALGVRFYDEAGTAFIPAGGTLARIARIDRTGLDSRVGKSSFTVMCDVRNPLCGPQGAAFVYGPQKGATPEQLPLLDAGLRHLNDCLMQLGIEDISHTPGGGAAGGLGAGCLAFLQAELKSGSLAILDLFQFAQKARTADLIITGEGRLDDQSLSGKVLSGVLRQCGGTPVISICGKCKCSPEVLAEHGLTVYESGAGVPLEESIAHADRYIAAATIKAMDQIKNYQQMPVPGAQRQTERSQIR